MAVHEDTKVLACADGERLVIPLHAEEASVTRKNIVRGTVRIEVTTKSGEHVVDELLAQERVETLRVPIGRRVETVPDVRQEGDTTIIPIVEEVVVTERQLILREEIHLRRVRTTEQYTETVTLRRQEANISRNGPALPSLAS